MLICFEYETDKADSVISVGGERPNVTVKQFVRPVARSGT